MLWLETVAQKSDVFGILLKWFQEEFKQNFPIVTASTKRHIET